jgi:ATP-dependent DNA ligase
VDGVRTIVYATGDDVRLLVADVTFRSWTPHRRLRQPSSRGLRSERDAVEVRLPG